MKMALQKRTLMCVVGAALLLAPFPSSQPSLMPSLMASLMASTPIPVNNLSILFDWLGAREWSTTLNANVRQGDVHRA
jgi:hypothetical protein